MASKRRLRRKSCEGKRRFDETDQAWVSVRTRGALGAMHVYQCRWCGKFHVGHWTGRQRRAQEGY
jgi:hypothetical protein